MILFKAYAKDNNMKYFNPTKNALMNEVVEIREGHFKHGALDGHARILSAQDSA